MATSGPNMFKIQFFLSFSPVKSIMFSSVFTLGALSNQAVLSHNVMHYIAISMWKEWLNFNTFVIWSCYISLSLSLSPVPFTIFSLSLPPYYYISFFTLFLSPPLYSLSLSLLKVVPIFLGLFWHQNGAKKIVDCVFLK